MSKIYKITFRGINGCITADAPEASKLGCHYEYKLRSNPKFSEIPITIEKMENKDTSMIWNYLYLEEEIPEDMFTDFYGEKFIDLTYKESEYFVSVNSKKGE